MEILGEIRKHQNARVFAFGIGTSVNRYLITGMGQYGNGDSEVITSVMQKDEVDAASKRLYEHLRSPLLTDISLDFGSLPVTDVYPTRVADLFSGRPVVVTGRFTRSAKGVVTLKGKRAGDPYTKQINVAFPDNDSNNSLLASLWARARVEHLMSQDLAGAQQQQMKPALEKEITQLGLDYRLMTQFTSFVAVEERVSTEGGKPRTVQVPVELPEGVQYEEQWGGSRDRLAMQTVNVMSSAQMVMVSPGVIGGVAGKVPHRSAAPPPPPPPPPLNAPSNGTGSGSGIGSGRGPGVGPGSGGGIGGGVYRVGGGGGGNREALAMPNEKTPLLANASPALRLLASKSHPKILAAYDCWSRLAAEKHTPNSTPCEVMSGPIAIDVVLNATDLTQLKALGFTADAPPARNRVRGRIPIDKLPALAALKEVQFIAPVKP